MRDRPAHFYRQSAVLPYRKRDGEIEVLLISSRRKKRWVLPKGICEPGLTAAASAAKEALEEAGIEGFTAETALGTYDYHKWGGTCSVEVFPMLVRTIHSDWSENHRDRVWVSQSEAADRVDEPALKKLLLEFRPS